MICIYTYIYIQLNISHIKENEIMLFVATWMDLDISILSEDKDKYHKVSLICEIFKYDTDEFFSKTEINSQT